jgi:hypothetical protein
VRCLLALVLALTVAGSSAAVPSMHVHAYGGHDHPDHQHGPASHRHDHDHDAPAIGVDDHHDDHDLHGDDGGGAAIRVEACTAGDHAVRIPAAATAPPQAPLQLAVLPRAILLAPATPVRLAFAPMDVRVHGPPPDSRLPARAPPLTFLA